MRPLVLANKSPIPALSGMAQRNLHLMRAVAALGPGDLIILGPLTAEEHEDLERELAGWTVTSIPLSRHARDVGRRMAWVAKRTIPTSLAVLGLESGAQQVAQLLGDQRRLIVALQSVPAAIALQVRRPGDRLVYDVNDAEDVKLQRSVSEPRIEGLSTSPGTRSKRAWFWLRNRIDVHAWRRFQAEAANEADLTLVCSAVDRQRYEAAGATLEVPNGAVVGERRMADAIEPGRLLFVGQMRYPPNERAAVRLAERIGPLVRQEIEDVTVRLVGVNTERVRSLDSLPGVEVAGFVEDLSEEWRRAAVLVVPLGTGGGTRLKILEALAVGVPVVSTAIGAEGIAVADEVHLRLAETDEAIAAAVIDVIRDPVSTEAMVARGHELVRERYQWSAIERRLTDSLRTIIG